MEAKTKDFFDRSVYEVADDLIRGEGMEIVVLGTDLKIRIKSLEEFKKVGRRWSSIRNLNPGDLWNPVHIKAVQSLIVTKPMQEPGTCVRITEVEYFHPLRGFIPEFTRGDITFSNYESDMAAYLNLSRNNISPLKFLDDTPTLYLSRARVYSS